ncbi:efflux RND transporter permease subunit [Cupriavidus necator]
MGAGVQRPLATVVVGGLLTSTALTILLIPMLFEWLTLRRGGNPNQAPRSHCDYLHSHTEPDSVRHLDVGIRQSVDGYLVGDHSQPAAGLHGDDAWC